MFFGGALATSPLGAFSTQRLLPVVFWAYSLEKIVHSGWGDRDVTGQWPNGPGHGEPRWDTAVGI